MVSLTSINIHCSVASEFFFAVSFWSLFLGLSWSQNIDERSENCFLEGTPAYVSGFVEIERPPDGCSLVSELILAF